MKKLNNKGFLLVETIVVATFTLTVLIALFLQFKNLLASYNSSYNYNTVEGIYNLNNVKDYISQYQNSANPINKQLDASSKPYLVLYNGSCSTSLGLTGQTYCDELMKQGNFKTVIFSNSDPTKLKNYLKSNEDSNISEEIKNLVNRLETVENQSRLIAEFNDGTLATIVFGVNQYNTPAPTCDTAIDLQSKVVTTGDGLYADEYETGRYVYKGAKPNNYITFNNEMWRILSVETDGTLKIIKNETIGAMPYDPGYSTSIDGVTGANSTAGTRYTTDTASYCFYTSTNTAYYGCNIWGSRTTMLDSNGNNITKMPKTTSSSSTYNLPVKEAYLNTYLNTTYYNNLNDKSKTLVQEHTWNVGPLKEQSGQTLETDLQQESAYKWKGKVGLINVTDYVKSNTNKELCGTVYANTYFANNYIACQTTSWLFNITRYWTLSPYIHSTTRNVWCSYTTTDINNTFNSADLKNNVRPVVYITSNIILNGSGTQSDPYTICEGGASWI